MTQPRYLDPREAGDPGEEAWRHRLEGLGLAGAIPFPQDIPDPSRRTFLYRGVVYKVTLTSLKRGGRNQDLSGEYELLRRCRGIVGIPRVRDYREIDGVELLALDYIDAQPLNQARLGRLQRAATLIRVVRVLVALSLRGISHNDIRDENVLVDGEGKVFIIDFDQATSTPIVKAMMRNLIGARSGAARHFGSWLRLAAFPTGQRIWRALPPSLRRSMRPHVAPRLEALPALSDDASSWLREVHRAWSIAQASAASSPGTPIAYYSLDFEGVRFPGERPWEPRWETFAEITTYRSKRILELGCNMGLLSCYLLADADAEATLGVDHDADILKAARHVAQALRVAPAFQTADFDSPETWEQPLVEFAPDIVFALNVLNWIQDKERFLRFLGQFSEVVFEGHDSLAVERARLRQAGFTNIRLVGATERSRPLMHCKKVRRP
jgi:predicted Ser/Thr protein kinase/SAM-dependent methyltransferase